MVGLWVGYLGSWAVSGGIGGDNPSVSPHHLKQMGIDKLVKQDPRCCDRIIVSLV
jgi:hypothetical protein